MSAVTVEHSGVSEADLRALQPRVGIAAAQFVVGERRLGVAVEVPRPTVGGCGIKGPPVLLGVLAVVALAIGQAEEAFLEPVVLPVPCGDREIEEPIAVAQPRDAVLAPAIGARMAVLEGEEGPCIAVRGVVLLASIHR